MWGFAIIPCLAGGLILIVVLVLRTRVDAAGQLQLKSLSRFLRHLRRRVGLFLASIVASNGQKVWLFQDHIP